MLQNTEGSNPNKQMVDAELSANEGSQRHSNKNIAEKEVLKSDFKSLTKQRKPTPTLDKYSDDLTARVLGNSNESLIVGRDAEIERLMEILLRRTKSHPIILGEAGVGKTALVEGLAQKIVAGDVPPELAGMRIVSLDLTAIVAGTTYRGEFEQRIKMILKELEGSSTIVFIDEIHTLVGAGSALGATDASNMLKPMLARGGFHFIGATTHDEYRKYFEKDSALSRRFQPVVLRAPNREQTERILIRNAGLYSDHHNIGIPENILPQIVALAERYLTQRHQPDKSLDILDETCSLRRCEGEMQRRSFGSQIKEIDKQLVELSKRKQIVGLSDSAIDQIADSEEKLDKKRAELLEGQQELPLLSIDDVLSVVSRMTGVPLQRMTQDEKDRYLGLEAYLKAHVIDQDHAVQKVSSTVRRARAGLADPNRPDGSFIFLGPTGVGKTELTKALAEFLFTSQDDLLAIDMSEYMEKHSVSRLVGAPPGYVGYQAGGVLTEAVRRKPYSVILFDEVEKAHPDVFNILLQLLEEGRLTDGLGREVDFRNTIIIMTSNLGAAQSMSPGFGFASANEDVVKEKLERIMLNEAEQFFRPELLNRIDEIIVFNRLSPGSMRAIVDKELHKLAERFKKSGPKLDVQFTDSLRNELATQGYSMEFGARPLRRLIQRLIEDELAELLLSAKVKPGSSLNISYGPAGVIVAHRQD